MTVGDAQRQSLAGARIGRGLSWLDSRLSRMPVVALGALVGLIAIAKSGVGSLSMFLWDPDTWPQPVDGYPYMSYGFRTLGALLRADTAGPYIAISALATAGALLIASWALGRTLRPDHARWAVIVLLSGPLVWVLAGGFGRPDPLTIAGGVIIGALGRQLRWVVPGTLLACLGNPEQTVVLALALSVATVSPSVRAWRKGAWTALVIATAVALSLDLWARSSGVATRSSALSEYWKPSLTYVFSALPLELYAGFGLVGLVIAWALLDSRWRDSIPLLLGAVGVPLVFTAVTLDQSRVLVACSSAAVVAVVVRYGPSIISALSCRLPYTLAVTAVAAVLLPPVEITADAIRVPWRLYVPAIQQYVIDRLH